MSAPHGFGEEAFGRQVGFADRLLQIVGAVPGFSHLALAIAKAFNLDTVEWVPRISLILIGAFISLLPVIIRRLGHLWLVITRMSTKGTGANGRFATFCEIFRNYTIPSMFSTVLSSYALGFGVTFIGYALLGLQGYGWVVYVLSVIFGSLFLKLSGSYKDIRKSVQPYPLGSYKGIRLYLTGGRRNSTIRGDVEEQRESHLLVLGPTGSGKTRSYFIPGILGDAHSYCSAIVVEAKAAEQEDMFKLIAPTWASQKKKVILFDPWGGGGVSFNPLMNLKPSFEDPKTRDTIEEIIDAIYRTYEAERGAVTGEGAYHIDREKRLLKGMMILSLFKPKGQRNLATICGVIGGTLESVVTYINSTINSKGGTNIAEDIRKNLVWFTDMDNGDPRLKSAMLEGLHGKLSVFSHPRVRDCVVNDELDLDVVFREPTLVCIKSPLNAPGASTIASIIVRLLMTKVPRKLSYGAGKDFKVYFYLDELPSLCIPKFDQFTKTARSSGTGIIAAIQDRADMADIIRARLGIASVDALNQNFRTQVLLPGLNITTAEFYSKTFGKREYRQRRLVRNTQSAIDFGYVVQRDEKPLLQPDSIRYMGEDMSIVMDSHTRPFFVKTVPWYKSARYKGMVKKNGKVSVDIYRKGTDRVAYEPPPGPIYRLTDLKKVKQNMFEDLDPGKPAISELMGQEYDGADAGGRPSRETDTAVDAMAADHDRSFTPLHKEPL